MRRRPIAAWAEELEAAVEHECTQCGGTIPSGARYERRVYTVRGRKLAATGQRTRDTLEVESFHLAPYCDE